jgi:hypothetical protein
MILSPAGIKPEKDCTGEADQEKRITDSSSRQRGRNIIINAERSKEIFKEKKLVTGPDCGLAPGCIPVVK